MTEFQNLPARIEEPEGSPVNWMVGIDDGDAVVGGVVDMDDEIEFRILS